MTLALSPEARETKAVRALAGAKSVDDVPPLDSIRPGSPLLLSFYTDTHQTSTAKPRERARHMSSLQLLPTEFSLVQDLNVLPSPSTFFASALPFSGHQPVFATASPPASHDTTYLSDYSASSPANSFTFSSNNHSRSASPATSYNDQPSPKLEPSSLVSAGAHHQHHAHQLHHPAPLAPLALADASAVLSSASSTANFAGLTSAAQHQELKVRARFVPCARNTTRCTDLALFLLPSSF